MSYAARTKELLAIIEYHVLVKKKCSTQHRNSAMVGRGIRNLISDGLYSKMPGSDYIYHAQCSYSLDQGSNQQRSTNSLSYYGGKVLCFIRQRLG